MVCRLSAVVVSAIALSACGLLLDPQVSPDASVMDASAADASVLDGGSVDASMPDAGRADGGEPACDCPSPRPCADFLCVDDECVVVPMPVGTVCGVGVCHGFLCSLCGDGTLQPDLGEECDDGNNLSSDTCEPDCTLPAGCSIDPECDDGDVCNGIEACVGGRCTTATLVTLADCEICDPIDGPIFPDADGDGHPAPLGQACTREPDCDDTDPAVNPAAADACGADNNCDGIESVLSGLLTCGTDYDGDGFPGMGTVSEIAGCSCGDGSAPVRYLGGVPLIDCWDEPGVGADVFPGQTAFFAEPYCVPGDSGCVDPFDYDCDGVEEPLRVGRLRVCGLLAVPACGGEGWVGEPPGCGETGRWGECHRIGLLCLGGLGETEQQFCR